MTREAHVSDTINLPGPILYTLTHTASVPEVLEPFSAGTRVHAATVYASGP